MNLGSTFVRQVLHLWPELQAWLRGLNDTRFQPFCEYQREFLVWYALMMFVCQLGSRRMIDYELRELESWVLDNINRLAGTKQTSLPVNQTVSHALGHIGSEEFERLLTQMVRQLIRSKVLDRCRLYNNMMLIAVDATGLISYKERHCERCIKVKTSNGYIYQHHVLEAKIVSPCGLAISIADEFIENPEGTSEQDYQTIKQDCELKAFARLAEKIKARFPHLPICLLGDALYCCGGVIEICNRNKWGFIITFKKGRTPALWNEFQSLLLQSTQNAKVNETPDKTIQHYQWINALPFEDSEKREHSINAVLLEETTGGKTTTFAYITNIEINFSTVMQLVHTGGRSRWKIENQGFNYQKNSGLNLQHPYSHKPDILKSFYTLLQIAHMILQLFFRGSPLKNLAATYHYTPIKLFGSLKNICQRLLECLRNQRIPDEAFDAVAARLIQVRLDTS